MAGSPTAPLPQDHAERALIETELGTSILVEAAAGTGKTTSMVNRMVELLAQGRCTVDTLAAVTFTRKATAELRDRFHVKLEQAVQQAKDLRRGRLHDALSKVEQSFIGTIHSFCARLLRERPIEAGVDVAFRELDEDAERRLRADAWDEYAAQLHAADDPVLTELDESGLDLAALRRPYIDFARFPDVDEWPAGAVPADDDGVAAARAALLEYVEHMAAMTLPKDLGTCKLMPLYRDLPRQVRNTSLARTADLIDLLEDCLGVGEGDVRVTQWPGGRDVGRRERAGWGEFLAEHAAPLVERRHRRRYEPAVRVLKAAVAIYDRLRADRGLLSYQDLLLKAAALLRDKPHIRRYFRNRFTHLLVDEFQDTDPVQARVMLLLTADDADQQDWRLCRPVAGALFVVGDPKQSIYRFRRADIVTYNQVRDTIKRCGRVVELTTNFRSVAPLISWFNLVSADLFAGEDEIPGDYSPADSPMKPFRDDDDGDTSPVQVLAPPEGLKKRAVNEWEATAIARMIRDWIDRGLHVPGDFLVLTRVRSPLAIYARALQAFGMPVEVTGGTAVNDLEEVALLHTVLAAVIETDNPVALVGALRSALFGISDTMLYRFRKAGGEFNLYAALDHADGASLEPIDEAMQRLRRYADWVTTLRPVAAVERITADLGLFARAGAGPDGRDRAGGLCKAIELLRTAGGESWTAADLVAYLWNLVDPDAAEPQRHDGVPLRPHDRPAVRVMNVHQAKGLEAPIVFLADGTGRRPDHVDLHVQRGGTGPVRGFLEIRRETQAAWGRGRLLAVPADWEALQAHERLFQDAEEDRLLYVAATRAADRLVISAPAKSPRWQKLTNHVPDGDVITELPEVAPPAVPTETLPGDAPRSFAEGIGDRWAARRAATYGVERVKALSVKGAMAPAHPGEHGTEWGTVLHLLLEAAMAGSHGDLEPLAASALDEHGLDPRKASDAVALVRSVMGSDLWTRALAGTRCLTEVPIQFLQSRAGREVPTIVRGVIDLVFRETGGWVIVDYKTDDHSPDAIDGLVEHYAGQVLQYADAWQRAVDEPVCETGLYFVRTGRYRPVAPARAAPAGA